MPTLSMWTGVVVAELFLEEDDVEKVHDFEEECMDDLAKQKEFDDLTSTDERVRRTADRYAFHVNTVNRIEIYLHICGGHITPVRVIKHVSMIKRVRLRSYAIKTFQSSKQITGFHKTVSTEE